MGAIYSYIYLLYLSDMYVTLVNIRHIGLERVRPASHTVDKRPVDRHAVDAARVRSAQAQVQDTQRLLQSGLQVDELAAVAGEHHQSDTAGRARSVPLVAVDRDLSRRRCVHHEPAQQAHRHHARLAHECALL